MNISKSEIQRLLDVKSERLTFSERKGMNFQNYSNSGNGLVIG